MPYLKRGGLKHEQGRKKIIPHFIDFSKLLILVVLDIIRKTRTFIERKATICVQNALTVIEVINSN